MEHRVLTKQNLKEDGIYICTDDAEVLKQSLILDYNDLTTTGVELYDSTNTIIETLITMNPSEMTLEEYIDFFSQNTYKDRE